MYALLLKLPRAVLVAVLSFFNALIWAGLACLATTNMALLLVIGVIAFVLTFLALSLLGETRP